MCAIDISMYYQNIIFRGTEAEIISQLTKEIWDLYYGKDSDGSTPYMFIANFKIISAPLQTASKVV